MSEGQNYYFKPRNFAACIKKSGAIEEVIIFVLWELLVFGPHQAKLSATSYQQVNWHELLAIPVKHNGGDCNKVTNMKQFVIIARVKG